jgi:hypothetical protein
MWGPGGVDEVRMKKSWAHPRVPRGWVSGARVTHAGCGWVGAHHRWWPAPPGRAGHGRKRLIRRQGVRCSATKASLACGEEEEEGTARSLARVLSLFSRSLLLLFTSLLIPNLHSFRALSSGGIVVVCGGRVSVYLFCFVSSCGGEVWPERRLWCRRKN